MASGGTPDLKSIFELFAKFGVTNSDGTAITLKNCDKWMKQAKLFDKNLTTTDTGICFAKFKTKQMDLETFQKYIEDLCKTKKLDVAKFQEQLLLCGIPVTIDATKVAAMDVTNRLTDIKKYTGAHKERFDAEGKGKGAEGRKDDSKSDGYVQGFKKK